MRGHDVETHRVYSMLNRLTGALTAACLTTDKTHWRAASYVSSSLATKDLAERVLTSGGVPSRVGSAADRVVKIWRADSGRLLRTVELDAAPGMLAFNRDGSLFAMGPRTTR